eukprot:scaffold30157_cov26-Tisochrysis_lutea.AAC.1
MPRGPRRLPDCLGLWQPGSLAACFRGRCAALRSIGQNQKQIQIQTTDYTPDPDTRIPDSGPDA